MATEKKVIEGSNVSAAQLKDLFRQIAGGSISGKHMQRFLEHKNPFLKPKWTEKNGVIRLSVTSDGTSGKEWIDRLTKGGYHLSDWAKQVLRSDKFNPTNGVTYQVAILKGNLFSDGERTTRNVRAKADKLGLETPNPEVACLLREKLSDEELEEMGLAWIITMHEHIKDFVGDPRQLYLSRSGFGRGLDVHVGRPDSRWDLVDGFVLVSQGTVD